MHLGRFLVGALGVWRVTHLLQAEDGPWDVIVHVRRRAGTTFWGSLLDCFYCLSIWIALPVAVTSERKWRDSVLIWPALSAGAILLERLINRIDRGSDGPTAAFAEESEVAYGLLRESQTANSDGE
jgi:hypothetical protein